MRHFLNALLFGLVLSLPAQAGTRINTKRVDPGYCFETIEGYMAQPQFDFGTFDDPKVAKEELTDDDRGAEGFRFSKEVKTAKGLVTYWIEARERDRRGLSELTVFDPDKGTEFLTLDANCKVVPTKFCIDYTKYELTRAGISDSGGTLTRADDGTRRLSFKTATVNAFVTEPAAGGRSYLSLESRQSDGRKLVRVVDFDSSCKVQALAQWRSDGSAQVSYDFELTGEVCKDFLRKLAKTTPGEPITTLGGEAPQPPLDGADDDLMFFFPSAAKYKGSVKLKRIEAAKTECTGMNEGKVWSQTAPIKAPRSKRRSGPAR